MSVLIIGCGRSGTNLLLDILSGSPSLDRTSFVEDKEFFRLTKQVAPRYLSKCDTAYIRNASDISRAFHNNNHLRIIFAIRDPRDMVLSKLKRGQAGEDGNMTTADDATPAGCIEDLLHMAYLYDSIAKFFPERFALVKMEDVVLHAEDNIRVLSNKLGITYDAHMLDFGDRVRNKYKKERYDGKIATDQIELWKRWEDIYGGYFCGSTIIPELFKQVEPLLEKFNYAKVDYSTRG